MDVWWILLILIVRTVAEQSESKFMNNGTGLEVMTCVWPFAKTPSENCVNILIDRNNCGKISHKCNATYKSCSGGVCSVAPAIQLIEPKIIYQGALNGSKYYGEFDVNLPLNITLYDIKTNYVIVTPSGALCLGKCSYKYSESILPNMKGFSGVTAFPFVDDLIIRNGTSQGIYYKVSGKTPNRTLAFEYYATLVLSKHQICHFQVLFFENRPNIVQFIYLNVPDIGSYPAVGVQNLITGLFMQYSFREPHAIMSNMSITFDTKNNNYTAVLLCGSKTCTMNEACVQNMCIQRGRLSFTAHWPQRKGRGYIIVRTPLNHTIYFGSSRNKSSIDQGQHEQVGNGNQVDNIYWPLNRMPPKGSYKICFSTGSLLNGTDKSPVTVTIEIRRFRQRMETMSRTFNRSTTKLNACLDTSDTFIRSYSSEEKEQNCHFQILLFESNPGLIQFIYLNVPDTDDSDEIGVQNLESDITDLKYSSSQPFFMLRNMSIIFDTNQNIYTTAIICGSAACLIGEACVQNMCIQQGELSFTARWSQRKGQGYIIVRTPLNNTIYFGNSRNKSSVDQGQHEQVGDGNQVDNIYWPSNRMLPKRFFKICFSTGSLLNGTDKSPITVTIEIRRVRRLMETMTRTFNRSTTNVTECLETSDTFIGSYSSVICEWPYAVAPTATCVNILIDRNNCGKVGRKCNNTYNSCSGGVCGMARAIQLTEPKTLIQGAINGTVDSKTVFVSLPFNITLYNDTGDTVYLDLYGVSLWP
ncbi:unnamed protein product [Adineta steineri]|uniref:CUB domain-containing protein n=1 Tax=Adineta steineri TaxID=433720 RepID=A0A814Q2S2_9BILA|nr:unnamed protein product [Adineta steineri]CAF1296711.1 unnamed protein product [Adineta steineri]